MAEEPVDVLIIGAGASGAAVAWSLAETRMRIVCLEQGDWVKADDYPGTRDDWELAQIGAVGPSPNQRGRREGDSPNRSAPPLAASMFHAACGSTSPHP